MKCVVLQASVTISIISKLATTACLALQPDVTA